MGAGRARYGRLADRAAWDADQPRDGVLDAVAEPKSRPDPLNGFIRDAGLALAAE